MQVLLYLLHTKPVFVICGGAETTASHKIQLLSRPLEYVGEGRRQRNTNALTAFLHCHRWWFLLSVASRFPRFPPFSASPNSISYSVRSLIRSLHRTFQIHFLWCTPAANVSRACSRFQIQDKIPNDSSPPTTHRFPISRHTVHRRSHTLLLQHGQIQQDRLIPRLLVKPSNSCGGVGRECSPRFTAEDQTRRTRR